MDSDRKHRAEDVIPTGSENEAGGTKAAWQKPELEKFPLNDAQTGTVSGLADSELLS